MKSTKFGKNRIFYNWKPLINEDMLMPLEEVIDDINARLGELRNVKKEISDLYEKMEVVRHELGIHVVNGIFGSIDYVPNSTSKITNLDKIKDLIKQELKLDIDDYEYQTMPARIKLVKKSKGGK